MVSVCLFVKAPSEATTAAAARHSLNSMLPDTGPPVPPGCGRRLLHAIVDERASSGYARPVASIPRSRDISKGFRDISYSTFANAINRCAQWMLVELGKSSSLETLAYLGVPDLRYQILSIAAVKTGYSVKSSTNLLCHECPSYLLPSSFYHLRETRPKSSGCYLTRPECQIC